MYENSTQRLARHEEEIRRLKLRQPTGSVSPWPRNYLPLADYAQTTLDTIGSCYCWVENGWAHLRGTVGWNGVGTYSGDLFILPSEFSVDPSPDASDLVEVPMFADPYVSDTDYNGLYLLAVVDGAHIITGQGVWNGGTMVSNGIPSGMYVSLDNCSWPTVA